MLARELVGGVDFEIALSAESGLVGAADNRCRGLLAHVALDFHLRIFTDYFLSSYGFCSCAVPRNGKRKKKTKEVGAKSAEIRIFSTNRGRYGGLS